MNKIGWKYGLFGLLAWLFVSCQQEGLTDMGQGYLTVSLLEEATGEVTKATPAQLEKEIEGLFHLTIRNASGYTVYDDAFTDGSIRVAAGTYTVTATYGNNQPLALDAPYYTGESAQIQVTAGSTQATEVTCRLANALISIDWTNQSKFDAIYSNYGVQVQVGTASVKMTPADGKSAYLQAGKAFTLQFVGTRISDQATVTIPLTSTELPTTLTAKEHCKLTLSPDTQTGLKIQKAVVSQTTISETIPLEWLPAAEIKAVGFENNLLSFYETETPAAQLEFKLASALQDMAFELDFGDYLDENQQSLNGAYKLSELTPEQKQQLVNAGFILPQIGAQGAAYFTFSSLLAKLKSSASGPVNYTIKLTSVKANSRDIAAPITYSITVKRPLFSISVYPKNIWTKEFTVNELKEEEVQGGNYTRLKQEIQYQFSTDGIHWGNMGTDLCQKDLTPNTAYYVRALFRNEIPSDPISVTTYPEIDLASGDMEDWTIIEKGKYLNGKTLYTYSIADWETNNAYSTRYNVSITNYSYNTHSAVSCTKDVHAGNWAAELRNTAAGRGNTTPSSGYDFNRIPGELFLGVLSVNNSGTDVIPNDSYTIKEGISFQSKPTALEFYYKYSPLNEDSWKVYVALFDQNDQIMATKEVVKSGTVDTYQKETIPLDYDEDLQSIPSKIYVYFASSISRGKDLPFEERDVTIYKPDGSTQTMSTISGSVLKIDDISLIYEK